MWTAATPNIADPQRPLERIANPSAVRYVKLGRGGAWARLGFDRQIIPFGFHGIDHAPCAAGDWAAVHVALIAQGRTPSGATQGVRELRAFYELDDHCLWITFADGHLHWAFAAASVMLLEDRGNAEPSRYRRVIGAWSRISLEGDALTTRSLSSSLLRTASYRMTICRVEQEAYLLRRIRGEADPLHNAATALQGQLVALAERMIAALDWRDFEILVDLIFVRSGWRRGSALGEGEVDVDLMLDNASTGETAWVQIKSTATQAVLDDYVARFEQDGSCDRFFFACHSVKGTMALPGRSNLHLWTGAVLADVAIRSGLFDWLIERTL